MNRQVVIDNVKRIFANRGYNISSSEICDLLAQNDAEHFCIKFETDPNLNNIRYFSNSVKKYGNGIVISDSFDEKIRAFALDKGIMLWDRGDLEMQIGKMVLSKELEKYEGKQPEKKLPSIQEPILSNQPEINEYEKTIRIMLRCVPINIGKHDAFSIAEAKIGLPKSQALKFMPIWYYSYSFNIQKKYKSKIVDLSGEGEGYVHAITGENFFSKYRDVKENILIPTQNYEILQPLIQKRDAAGKALNYIIREHTKEVRLSEMIGDTIVFENRIYAPDPSEIDIKIDLLYVPFWEIKGNREIIDINGYDGHITGIKLYNDAEIL